MCPQTPMSTEQLHIVGPLTKKSLSEAILPKPEIEIPELLAHENLSLAVPGKVSILEIPPETKVEEVLQNFEKAARANRQNDQVLVTQLDQLPFEVPSVRDALRHIGIPETRIRQLLLQIGLQTLEFTSPHSLTPAQLRTLALVAALHGPQHTVILARPFEGLEPHVARTLSDFIVVATLEKKKSFLLLNPGPTTEAWRGTDWAIWKPFGGMNLNIPQEVLELHMARRSRDQTQENIQQELEKNPQEAGIKDVGQVFREGDPFQAQTENKEETSWQISQRTQASDGAGMISLPLLARMKVSIPDFFFGLKSGERPLSTGSLFFFGFLAGLFVWWLLKT